VKGVVSKVMDEDLVYEILSVVEEIPEGQVATYGQIARLIGREQNSRLVGKVLSMASYYGSYPCHRVVNCTGRLVPGWLRQKKLLTDEGVAFKDECHVDLKKSRWNC
jgi:methylated-DNA-protein-cysteine methyltransferase-like protein